MQLDSAWKTPGLDEERVQFLFDLYKTKSRSDQTDVKLFEKDLETSFLKSLDRARRSKHMGKLLIVSEFTKHIANNGSEGRRTIQTIMERVSLEDPNYDLLATNAFITYLTVLEDNELMDVFYLEYT